MLHEGSMTIDPTKLTALRKGLLEFLILGVVSADEVYAADILRRLSTTDFATQEGTLYPLLSKMRREGLLDYEWQEFSGRATAQVLPTHRERANAVARVSRVLVIHHHRHRGTRDLIMQTVISIHLDDQADPYRLHEDAFEALKRYLDRARTRLADDPDRTEVMGDLERSIGSKLADRRGTDDRILTIADIDAVLAEIGPVGTGDDQPVASDTDRPHGRRRLRRIREGQSIAGVCTGLSAYSEIRIDWVRTVFVLLTLATAGLFAIVYLVLAFALPIVPTREAWIAAQD